MNDTGKPWAPVQMFWSAVLGIVVWSAIGFSWFGDFGFGWRTAGSAQVMANEAVKTRLVGICVAQARADPETKTRLVALEEKSIWSRGDEVNKFGWTRMPGENTPTPGIATACAEQLASSS